LLVEIVCGARIATGEFMKFWQAVSWAETEQLCEIARIAEEVGFEGVMGSDHALHPEVMSPSYPYSESGVPPQTAESEYPDMWTSCAAMAAVTKRLRFVCAVYILPLRNPIEVAKQAATLATLSSGRFVLGVGTGWMKEEFDIYGVDFATRGRRTDEMIEVMRALWAGGAVEHHGEFFDFPAITVSPKPKYPVPIYFGGAAPVALRRTARDGDGWIGAGNTVDQVPELMAKLTSLRAASPRANEPLERVVGIYGDTNLDTFRRLEENGMTAGVSLPFNFALGGPSTLDQKRRVMEEFAEAVLRHFC
jgi:probable F420-dependent oxidoreductase